MGGVASAVNGIVGGIGGALTPQNQFQAVDPGYTQAYQQAQTNQAANLGNQNSLAQALLAQSNGTGGPNLAQAQLAQTTDANVKQGAGLIASQKGISPGLAARQIAENTANVNQQAAQQGAVVAGQQQLGAQNALANVYGTIGSENLTAANTAAGGANSNNAINAGTSAQNAAATQKTTGGLLNGAAAFLAHGGMVPGYADGGQIHPLAAALMGYSDGGDVSDVKDASSVPADSPLRIKTKLDSASSVPADSPLRIKTFADGGMTSIQDAMNLGSFGNGQKQGASGSIADQLMARAGVANYAAGNDGFSPNVKMAKATPYADQALGAEYNNKPGYGLSAPGEFNLDPNGVDIATAGPTLGTFKYSDGGKVPGKAVFGGDDPKNDTVPAMLSPGEIVIPRTKTKSLADAKAFIEEQMAKKNAKSSMSLKNEDDDHYEIAHPNGSSFKVSKKGISEKLAAEIKGMGQKLSDGTNGDGVQADVSADVPQALDPNSPVQSPLAFDPSQGYSAPAQQPGLHPLEGIKKVGSLIGQGIQNVMVGDSVPSIGPDGKLLNAPQAAPQAPQIPMPGQQQQSSQQAPAQTTPSSAGVAQAAQGSPYDAILNKQMSLVDQAGKLNDIAQMHQAKAYDDYLGQLANQQRMTQQIEKQHSTDLDQLHQAIVNTNIDPNRFWNSKSTGSKISTAIGLMLGGAGAGLSGQPNLAYNNLQTSIAQDIDAQKADLGKKENLYSYNLARYRDDRAAQAATQSQLYTVAQATLQKQAAQDGSPQALLHAQMAINDIQLKKKELSQQFAQSQVKSAFYGAGQGANQEGGLPAAYEGAIRSNPNMKDVPIARIGNRIYPAVSKEAAEEQRQLEPLGGNVVDNLSALQKISSLGAKMSPDDRAHAEVLRGQLLADIPKLKSVEIGGKRIPESEIELAKSYLGDPTSFMQSLTSGARNQRVLETLQNEIEGKRRANVIGYKGTHSLGATPGFK